MHQLRYECWEGIGVVTFLENTIVDEALLFTDGPNYSHPSTTTIWLSKCHVFLQPYSFTHHLLVELTFINVDYLFPCHHQLWYEHYRPLLVFADLLLPEHLPAVGILRLHIPHLMPFIEWFQGIIWYLDTHLLFKNHHPLLKRVRCPSYKGLLLCEVVHHLWCLPLRPVSESFLLVYDLASIQSPSLAYKVWSYLSYSCDLLNFSPCPLFWSHFSGWSISKEYNQLLHLNRIVLVEGFESLYWWLLLFFNWMFWLSLLLQLINHLTHFLHIVLLLGDLLNIAFNIDCFPLSGSGTH